MDAARGEIVVGSSILFSKIEDAGSRFPDFVPEIQAILRQGKLPVGTAEAVPSLAEAMAHPGHLRDDLLSMVNVLCYQEAGISTLDLLGLLLVAAAGQAGAGAAATTPALEEPVRRIFNLLVDARRLRQEEEEARLKDESAGDRLVEPEDFVKELTPEQLAPAPLPPREPLAAASAEPRGSVLARALAISADEDHVEHEMRRERAPAAVEVSPAPAVATAPAPAERLRPAGTLFAAEAETPRPARRFPAWATGLCGVLLGLLLGFLVQARRTAPTPVQAPAGTEMAEARGVGSSSAMRNRSNAAARTRGGAATEKTAATGERSRRTDARAAYPERFGPSVSRHAGNVSPPNAAGTALPLGPPSSGASRSPASARSLAPRTPLPPPVRGVDLNAPAAPDSAFANRNNLRLPSVVTGASGIMAANLIASPAPAYPVAANAARVQGEVVVQAVVDRDGNVTEARVVSGPLLLRDAAVDAVQRWRYRPYEVDGKPAEIGTTARVEFRLNH